MAHVKTVGAKVKIWPSNKDISQDYLALKADIPHPTLVKVQAVAVQDSSIETIMKIAIGLDIALDELTK